MKKITLAIATLLIASSNVFADSLNAVDVISASYDKVTNGINVVLEYRGGLDCDSSEEFMFRYEGEGFDGNTGEYNYGQCYGSHEQGSEITVNAHIMLKSNNKCSQTVRVEKFFSLENIPCSDAEMLFIEKNVDNDGYQTEYVPVAL